MKPAQRQAGIGPHVRRSLAVLLVCATLCALPCGARANMAARQPEARAGGLLGEPFGLLKSVHIERETLLIDLRPLADLRPAVVEATYKVRNDGEARALELVFVADGLSADGGWVWNGSDWVRDARAKPLAEAGVWLDGARVEGARAETGAELPEEFRPPSRTPALYESQEELPYKTEADGTIIFRVTLAPGPHTFVVRYAARPSAFADTLSHEINWQLGYVLAPARRWESFGGLDAKVLLPTGWHAASEPALTREGDALVKSWDVIPADSLAITFKTRERTVFDSDRLWLTLIILGLLLTAAAGFAGWKAGAWLGRRKRTSAWALLFSPVVAGALFALAYAVGRLLGSPPAPEQNAFNEVGNYDFIITFLLGVLSVTLHFVVAQTCAFISRRRLTRRPA
ncbi:MAG TPA: hypothetical protein VFS10_18875 [Pyrinomonadaceae bacterium]|nr:hypothetical protein [Pyrinomonadaceae bacterium]